MTAFTLNKNTNIRQLTVAGGYSARTGGDTIANTNGFSLTIDQDTRFGLGAPADTTTAGGSLGSITQTAASGGDILIDASKVWLIPYNTGSGTLTPTLAGVTISGATANTIGLYSAMTVAPVLTGVATGWLKVTNVSGSLPSSGTFTSDGFTYTITGAAIRGWIEVTGEDGGTFTGNRLGKFQVTGAWYEIGTTSGSRTTTYNVPNNGKQLWVPALWVQGATWTITAASWAAGVATFTATGHDMLVGQRVTVTGVTPSGYNVDDVYITDLTDNTFSVALVADPGTWTSGGTAVAYENWPCAGTIAATAANVVDENTRRGKLFWNTNATTSLALPLGYIRFGHDGTNSTGGYCPPAGRKIRIGNVFFTNVASATTRNQNSIPHATFATRYDFTMTGAGRLYIDKAMMNWYPSIAQAQAVEITDTGIMSQITVSECPTFLLLRNLTVGQEAATVNTHGVSLSINPGGTLCENVIGTVAASSGTTSAYPIQILTSQNVVVTDCVGWMYGARTGTGKYNTFTLCPGILIDRLHCIAVRMYLVTIVGGMIRNTKYTDSTGLRSSAQIQYVFNTNGLLTDTVVEGLKIVGYRASPWGGLVENQAAVRGPVSFRNMGTYANPVENGDGPYYNKSYSTGGTTTTTVTHIAHGFVAGDVIYVFHSTSINSVVVGAKTILAGGLTADQFTFTGLAAADTTGKISYWFAPMSGVVFSLGSGMQDVKVQRCYVKFGGRGGFSGADNSSSRIEIENSFGVFKPSPGGSSQGSSNLTILDSTAKLGGQPTGAGNASVYGSVWADGTYAQMPDTDAASWSRTGTTVLLTLSGSVYANQVSETNNTIEILTSDDETALNTGITTTSVATVGAAEAHQMKVVGYNVGATSGNCTFAADTGRVSILMNEASVMNIPYTLGGSNSAGAGFNGSGGLILPVVGDTITYECPYWIKGHTGFMTAPPAMSGGTIANYNIEYQIDTGSGWSAWKTAFRQTVTAVADWSIGAYAVTGLAAGDTWFTDGDYVVPATIGALHRKAKIATGGGTTTLTLDKPHNGNGANNALIAYRMPSEAIDPNDGFKLKIRITTIIASSAAITALSFRTFTDATSRQFQLPLDTITLTLTGLVAGSDIVVLAHGTETILGTIENISGTTYDFTYETPQAVDIAIYKEGYIPHTTLYNYMLGSSDASVPVVQAADPSYLT